MLKSAVLGYPRIGENRELKKVIESYFNKTISQADLLTEAEALRKKHWLVQKENNIDYISSNDFSFYDNILDLAFALNVIPKRYTDLGLNELDTYFAMARGYQENDKDVKALRMKKWFNTNYHYMVPEITKETSFNLNFKKLISEYKEAKELGLETKPVLIGPYTFLKLAYLEDGLKFGEILNKLVVIYIDILKQLNSLGVEVIQIDEPAIVFDMSKEEISLFIDAYKSILANKGNLKIICQTYFGDVRDIYQDLINLDFDFIGLDFVEGSFNLDLIKKNGFANNKVLIAGLVNGRNIWKSDYQYILGIIDVLKNHSKELIIATASSLLFCPYSLKAEIVMADKYKKHLAMAEEKLQELSDLKALANMSGYQTSEIYLKNKATILEKKQNKDFYFEDVRNSVNNLNSSDFDRPAKFSERKKIQAEVLNLPVLPTTTIGSFPQTKEIRELRSSFKKGMINADNYQTKIEEKIKEVIKMQEDIGLDVLVHGEFERNDMVEYFGENLSGFLFTQNAWVQSYGTRCVKPPIIFGDVKRLKPITVDWATYSQSLSGKYVKGMLTGPVTILNWSFPRLDISLKEIAFQIALAIRDEVLDLEKAGIKVIQIDEAALREKLPLRKINWQKDYLDWAVNAFRIVHAKVKNETQIHTHMCYSEFSDIIKAIKDLDADVLSIESARSNLSMLDILRENNYENDIGPGVYDIHSPRVPSIEEIKTVIKKMIAKLSLKQIWVNPDCGLKTRKNEEVLPSLKNMVQATIELRKEF